MESCAVDYRFESTIEMVSGNQPKEFKDLYCSGAGAAWEASIGYKLIHLVYSAGLGVFGRRRCSVLTFRRFDVSAFRRFDVSAFRRFGVLSLSPVITVMSCRSSGVCFKERIGVPVSSWK